MQDRGTASRGAPGGRHLVGVITERDSLAELVTAALDSGSFSLARAAGIGEMLSDLQAGFPESFLVDLQPGVDRVRRLSEQILAELGGDPATPVIGVGTNAMPAEARVALLRGGLWDCLTLPAQEVELALKLDSFTAAKRAVDSYQATSMLDPATGLYNVRGFIRRLHEAFAAADRAQGPVACVVLGLDPSQGAAAGPMVLEDTPSILALALSDICRTSDVVGRLGPSEFAIVSVGTGPQEVPRMVRRLLTELDRRAPGQVSGAPSTVLAGYAAIRDAYEAGIRPVEILTRARTALDDLRSIGGDRMRGYENGGTGGSPPGRPNLRLV